MTQHTTVLCIISSMVFTVKTPASIRDQLLLEQMQSDPQLVPETRLIFEDQLLLEEIQYVEATGQMDQVRQ